VSGVVHINRLAYECAIRNTGKRRGGQLIIFMVAVAAGRVKAGVVAGGQGRRFW
jgi:hypothetical protein